MLFVILGLVFVFLFVLFIQYRNFKQIVYICDNYNVLIAGLRGTGKDTLMANYLGYSNRGYTTYMCPFDYKIKNLEWVPLDFKKLDINNDYHNFLNGNINKYVYPYEEKAPIMLPDAEIYFPASYEKPLKNEYIGLVNFMPLSRQLGNTQVICNSQRPAQIWDKLRSQSDKYIYCLKCRYFLGFVFMKVRIYEKYESFDSHVPPFRAPLKLIGNKKIDISLAKTNYSSTYGSIIEKKLFFKSKSKYDTRYFKSLLENVCSNNSRL